MFVFISSKYEMVANLFYADVKFYLKCILLRCTYRVLLFMSEFFADNSYVRCRFRPRKGQLEYKRAGFPLMIEKEGQSNYICCVQKY